MSAYATARFGSVTIDWRRIEWWAAGFALYLQTGAIGGLGTRVVLPPAYAITAILVANNWRQMLVALRRTPLLVFLFVLPFLSVAWSVSGSLTLRRAVALACSMALAYVIAIRFTPRQFLLLTAAVLVPGLVASLVLFVVSPAVATMPDGAVKGVFGHKNLLGWHAAVAVLAGAIMIAGGLVSRRVGLAVVALGLVCLLAAGSATALLSLAVAFLLALLYRPLRSLDRPGRMLLVLLTLQLGAAVYIIGSAVVAPALESMGKDTSLTGRIPLWHLVDPFIERQPLFGYGYEAFWSAGSGAGWRIRSEVAWDVPNAHNGYREILLAFGLAGFVPFVVVTLRALFRGALLHRSSPDGSWLWPNVVIGMLLLMNATESIFYVPRSFLFILFTTAVLMITLREADFHCRNPAPDSP